MSFNPQEAKLEAFYYFPTVIYSIKKTEFLSAALPVAQEFIDKRKQDQELNELYPAYMTDNLHADPRIAPLAQFIAQTGWNILNEQGYNMQPLSTFFTEFWCQEHYRHSAMEQHVHGYGAQLVGFYFLECPEDCSRVVFHDPKSGKVMINLRETDPTKVTHASNQINFKPEPGQLMLTNSWLAHSFTRHASITPMKFIHFNIAVQVTAPVVPAPCQVAAEVV